VVEEIEQLRRQRRTGKQIAAETGVSPATVSRVLRRLGLNKLSALEPAELVRRYAREKPGELIHLDIKKLGRIGSVGHLIRVLNSLSSRSSQQVMRLRRVYARQRIFTPPLTFEGGGCGTNSFFGDTRFPKRTKFGGFNAFTAQSGSVSVAITETANRPTSAS
jgi:hypothetical protein